MTAPSWPTSFWPVSSFPKARSKRRGCPRFRIDAQQLLQEIWRRWNGPRTCSQIGLTHVAIAMRIELTAAALRELQDAIDWYESKSPDLADALLREFHAARQRSLLYPHAWQPVEDGFRKCLLTRFPYGLIYQVEDDRILILALSHLKRRPDHWRRRISKS